MRFLSLVTDAFGGIGGIAKFNRDLLTALCAYPHCREVVAIPRLMPFGADNLPERLTYVRGGLGGKIKYGFTVCRTCLRDNKLDLVICGHIHLLPLAYMLRFMGVRAPLVLILHGIEAWKRPKSSLILRWVHKVDGIIAVSEFTRSKFAEWACLSDTPMFILPNAVDLNRFSPGEKRVSLMERYGLKNKKVIMTLCRLDQNERCKGIDETLEVLPEIAKDIPNIAYLIAGDGSDRNRLEKKAKLLEVRERVVFTGYVAEDEKADHYRIADAYVMPGWGEGFGIAYLEALASGVPVVGSKNDASAEVLHNGKLGIVVDPRNKNELKAGIIKALTTKRVNAITELNHFSCERFRERLYSIIRESVK